MMKARYTLILSLVFVGAVLLAFFLRGAVQAGIILPLARFAWLVKGYYGAFPQAVYWGMAIAAAVLLVAIRFRLPELEKRHRTEKRNSSPGHVEELSFWIQRGENGFYPKWHIAHLLAELALDILDQRGKREKHILRIKGSDLTPPEEVEKYLDAALNTNFTDYPRPKRFFRKPSTPFDLDIESVIRYLESLMGSKNDNHS
jgi:hypothetical protein